MCFHLNTLRKGPLPGAIPSRIDILHWIGWKAFAVVQQRGCAAQRIKTAWLAA